MYNTRDVTLWRQDFRDVDLDTPSLMLTFAGIFGHLMLLEWDYNTTLSIANPLLGLQKHKNNYFPKMLLFKICSACPAKIKSSSLTTTCPSWRCRHTTSASPRWRRPRSWRTRPGPSSRYSSPSFGKRVSSTSGVSSELI